MGSREPTDATLDLGARYDAALFDHHEALRFSLISLGDKRYYSWIADGHIVGNPGTNTAYSGALHAVLASIEFDPS